MQMEEEKNEQYQEGKRKQGREEGRAWEDETKET